VIRVWLPFDARLIGGIPNGMEAELFDATGDLPDSADIVEFYVPDYRFDPRVVEVIPSLVSLRVVQTLTAGVDHLRPYVPDGVVLCNARGVHDASTAELAVTLTLASLRGIPDFVRDGEQGRWAFKIHQALADKTVLIVGYGSIGAAVERRLTGFECEVLRVARSARDGVPALDALPGLLPDADVVILTVPMTAETTAMVDASFLALMHDDALLVNVARGPVVDTPALVAEVATGRLRAALDVTEPEPLPPDHPLWGNPRVLISPHVGGASSAFWPRAHRLVRDQLRRYAAGEPLLNQIRSEY
jgi:phosphoglycerate dehydrogenase-like enzyme